MKLDINSIRPNEEQPRTKVEGIKELAESIKEKGLLEPIMVRPVGDEYEIVHGERRWRACKRAGMTEIEAVVRELDDRQAYELALVENMQRENLTPIEQARAFKRLQDEGYTQAEIAETVGKGRSYVAQKLRLLKLPEFIAYFLQENLLTENHIRQIMKLKNIYGEDLEADFDPEAPELAESLKEAGDVVPHTRLAKNDECSEVELSLLWLEQLTKPEDWPFALVFMLEDEVKESILKASTPLLKCVSKHTLKQWERAAFWWCMCAVALDESVAELAERIEGWQQRYYSALEFVCKFKDGRATGRSYTVGQTPDGDDEVVYYDEHELFQAYAEDLLCSSSYEQAGELYSRALDNGFVQVMGGNTYAPHAVSKIERETFVLKSEE